MCFVSNDQKADWFYQHDKSALAPRAELLYQYVTASDLKTVHFMKTSEFALAFGAGNEAVEEIKRIEESNQMDAAINAAREAYLQSDEYKTVSIISTLRTQLADLERKIAQMRARGEFVRKEDQEAWGLRGAIQHYEQMLRR
jgi:hypothetical protein